jgi:predicted O-methyltransferase YrrM
MSQKLWSRVDDYIVDRLAPADPALEAALEANAKAGLPGIDVSPAQGKFLHLLAKMIQARRILEIGTLGGYSTIWLARALPRNGRLVSLEADKHHAEVAAANIQRAGLADRVAIKTGRALDTLPAVEAEGAGPFDLIFIDADKPNNSAYLAWALKLARSGSVIVCDNVIRDGAVADAETRDASALGARRLFDLIAAEPRLTATALQTVGAKGWDGFAIAVVD